MLLSLYLYKYIFLGTLVGPTLLEQLRHRAEGHQRGVIQLVVCEVDVGELVAVLEGAQRRELHVVEGQVDHAEVDETVEEGLPPEVSLVTVEKYRVDLVVREVQVLEGRWQREKFH